MASVNPNEILREYFTKICPEDKKKISWLQRKLIVIKNRDGTETIQYKRLNPFERIGALFGGKASLKSIAEFCIAHDIQNSTLATKIEKYNLNHPNKPIAYSSSLATVISAHKTTERPNSGRVNEPRERAGIVDPVTQAPPMEQSSTILTNEEIDEIRRSKKFDFSLADVVDAAITKFVNHSNPILHKRYPDWFANDGAKFRELLLKSHQESRLELVAHTAKKYAGENTFMLHALLSVLPEILPELKGSYEHVHFMIIKTYVSNCLQIPQNLTVPASLVAEAKKNNIPLDQYIKDLAIVFCRQIANQMIKPDVDIESVVYDRENSETVEEWSLYFGDYEEARFLLNVCKNFINEKTIHENGRKLKQYSFVDQSLRDYFPAT